MFSGKVKVGSLQEQFVGHALVRHALKWVYTASRRFIFSIGGTVGGFHIISNYYFFMILRDPNQFLGKILTCQNIGKNSLYDADVSSLWKNVDKKWCIIAISGRHQLFV